MKHRLFVIVLLGMVLTGGAGADGLRPHFPFTTEEAFDAGTVPAYGATHEKIYAHIDAHQDDHLDAIRRWVRQRSISAQSDGIAEMAEMLRSDLSALGFEETAVVPTSGHPGVWGYYDAGAEKTIVVYMMYDVQPVDPADWSAPPFDGAIVENEYGRVLLARGATNQKGPERAFLNAVSSTIATTGTLPVNLMVLAEGEEELGSPHYPELIDKYEDRLRTADGVFFPFNSEGPTGEVGMFLGVKGILYFEMEAVGNESGGPMRAEIHGSYKAIVDSPVLRLVQAIASLTSRDGNTILVPGYYDAIRPPTEEEQKLVNGRVATWSAGEKASRASVGVNEWIDGMTGRDSLLEFLFMTTLNVDGLWGGYTGDGVKTILPHKATAKIDSRLVPNQNPDEALALIRSHLDANGFSDIVLRKLSGYPPAQTSVRSSLVQAAIGVYSKYGKAPAVSPRIAGSAPYYVFTDRLGLPLVAGGLGYGTGAHAPNEFMVVEAAEGTGISDLATIEKFYVDLLHALGEAE